MSTPTSDAKVYRLKWTYTPPPKPPSQSGGVTPVRAKTLSDAMEKLREQISRDYGYDWKHIEVTGAEFKP